MDQTLPSHMRLKGKTTLDRIYRMGIQGFVFPFKYKYIIEPIQDDGAFKIAISVPKRTCKRAVDRNQIKRHTREAIRKNKQLLADILRQDTHCHKVMLIYVGSPDTSVVKGIEKVLVQLNERFVKQKELLYNTFIQNQ